MIRTPTLFALALLAACGAPTVDETTDDTDAGETDETDDTVTEATDDTVETDDTDDTTIDTDTDTDACLDVDVDGICDNVDLCEGDNSTGDHDGDGVCGDRDACTGGDASGDTDADGVCDDTDVCLGPDSTGDGDLDGVCDDLDACVGDDATGDADSDGTCDDLDLCPLGADDDLDFSGWPDACEPVEIGRLSVNYSGFGTTLGEFGFVTLLLEGQSCPGTSGTGSSGGATIGGALAVADGQTGSITLDASNESDFDALVACFTDGSGENFYSWGAFSSGPGQPRASAGNTVTEASFGASVDYAGYVITSIDLSVTSASVSVPTPGTTAGAVAGEWVLHGYALP